MTFLKSRNKNIYQPSTADWAKRRMRANFSREIEFFEFCKHRLHRQHLAATALRPFNL